MSIKNQKVLPAGYFEVKRSSNERKEVLLLRSSLRPAGCLGPLDLSKRRMGCKEPSRVGGMETAL